VSDPTELIQAAGGGGAVVALVGFLVQTALKRGAKAEDDQMRTILETLTRIDKTTQKLETEAAVDRNEVSNMRGQLAHIEKRLQGISEDYSERLAALEEKTTRLDERSNVMSALRDVLREEREP
jgi:septal ring factor EnvC (AmiA/AmiB activator)